MKKRILVILAFGISLSPAVLAGVRVPSIAHTGQLKAKDMNPKGINCGCTTDKPGDVVNGSTVPSNGKAESAL